MPATVTTKSVDPFWRVADILEQDEMPADAKRDALFSAPGYTYYFTVERHSRSAFRELMRLIFMPSKADVLRDSLANGGRQLRPDLRPPHVLLVA